MASAKRTRDLDAQQNEAARELFRRLLKDRTQVDLAATLGLTQTAVSGFLSGRQGTSRGIVELACELAGEDPATILGARPRLVLVEPNASRAAVAALQSLSLESPDDPPVAWWGAKLATYETALRTADALGPKVTERGDPLEDL